MDIFQTLILALVQGISEFLPISSSAHLILVPELTGWQDQGLAFDVVVHFATLLAVIFYYRYQLKSLSFDFYNSILSRQKVGESNLAWGILLGTIPVALLGWIFKDFIAINLRSVAVISYATLAFGGLLAVGIWVNFKNLKPRFSIGWLDVFFIAMMQILALIPGTSRSGITITAGLLIGLSKKTSIQFSFLLSIPVIILATGSILLDLYQQPQIVNVTLLFLGFVIAGISSYFSIVFFIKLLDVIGLMPFVIYRLLLG
ncbi:MAG: undecaprenyl-diphosphate phosphatase, partial [Candidatus Thioglobus sp.]|nr:undecaprenyl-diphosphate phosphatase [Candidatus Thioglobus sp.]